MESGLSQLGSIRREKCERGSRDSFYRTLKFLREADLKEGDCRACLFGVLYFFYNEEIKIVGHIRTCLFGV